MNLKEFTKHKRMLPFVICSGIIAVLLVITISIFYFKEKVLSLNISNTEKYAQFEKHYALITGDTDIPFWDSVYNAAEKEAKKYNTYVEYMGKDLSETYDVKTLLRIAIDSSVDGIIIEADESPKVTELINEAVKKDIAVVTVLKDNPKSQRQCFVGINNYNLGQVYGQQVLKIRNEKTKRILVLMDSGSSEANQNIIFAGIKETIRKALPQSSMPDIQNVTVNNENAFGSEEAIRDIIINTKNLPDIMICLSSIDTQCAYQAVVDHNKVGSINILGYYNSPEILSAVQKQIIHSTISIDAKQMGALSVQALNEYVKAGHVSDYFSVNTQLITLENVNSFIKKENSETFKP